MAYGKNKGQCKASLPIASGDHLCCIRHVGHVGDHEAYAPTDDDATQARLAAVVVESIDGARHWTARRSFSGVR